MDLAQAETRIAVTLPAQAEPVTSASSTLIGEELAQAEPAAGTPAKKQVVKLNRALRRLQAKATREKPDRRRNIQYCSTCNLPFLGGSFNRCQCRYRIIKVR
jgi:hypothetical protein